MQMARLSKRILLTILGGLALNAFSAPHDEKQPVADYAFAEILKLKGQAFYKTLDDYHTESAISRCSFHDLAHLIVRMQREFPHWPDWPDRSPRISAFWTVFQAACRSASVESFPELTDLLIKTPDDLFLEGFEYYIVRWYDVKGSSIAGNLPGMKFEPFSGPVPEHLKAASPDLQAAWRSYRAAIAPFDALDPYGLREDDILPPDKPKKRKVARIAFVDHSGRYMNTVRRMLLAEDSTGFANKIAAFHWAGSDWQGCGMGPMGFHRSHKCVLCMALLREQRPEVVGAAFGVELGENEPAVLVRLLQRIGLDWELVFVGASAEDSDRAGSYNYYTRFAGEVAAHGSVHGVRLVLDLARIAKFENRKSFVSDLESRLRSSAAPDQDHHPSEQVPLPDDLKAEIRKIVQDSKAEKENP